MNFRKYFQVRSYDFKIRQYIKRLIKAKEILNNGFIFGDQFSSGLIHTNSLETQRNWQSLYRGYEDELLIKETIQDIRHFTMVTYDGLMTTYNISKFVLENNISGVFVETGTWMGGSAAMICAAIKNLNESRKIHLFDSFEGLPNPQQVDYEPWMEKDWALNLSQFDGVIEKCGALIARQSDVENVLFNIIKIPPNIIKFHVGWFQDTVPEASKTIGEIAVLRLDGDLYESTLICLRHLYPLVVKGGFIIIDDYGLKGCRQACEDFFREINIKPYLHFIDAVGRYFVKE